MDDTNKCALVIEDDPLVRHMLERFLRHEHFHVLATDSISEAVIHLRRHRPDITLLDVQLGEENGLDFLRKHLIQETGPYRVIVLSGNQSRENAEAAVQAGAYDYLIKPTHLGKLKIAIQNCLKLQQMAEELSLYSSQPRLAVSLHDFIGTSPEIINLLSQIKRIASIDVPVVILGESGTGKELVARLLHSLSPRRHGPFIPLDCGAIPDALMEAELFGYEPGAFSGANHLKHGKFERAHNGTLLLDEIGNFPLSLQPKILRTLQFMQVERLGGNQPILLNVRVLAATNSNLDKMVAIGTFREDLFHRLNTVILQIPPLRQRVEDIRLLAHAALLKANRSYQTGIHAITQEAMALLERYPWPGNVRELENCIRSAVILADNVIEPAHLPKRICQEDLPAPESALPPEDLNADWITVSNESLFQIGRRAAAKAERIAITDALCECNWNKAEVARRLKVDYKSLHNKIKQYGITPRTEEGSSEKYPRPKPRPQRK